MVSDYRFPSLGVQGTSPIAVSTGASQKSCVSYARLAVTQEEINREVGCGLSGPRWIADFKYHYDWCVAVSANTARPENKARQQLLDQCTHQERKR